MHTLLTPNQVADYLGIDEQTLAVWRCTKRYKLAYIKTGRLVRYKLEDLNDFLDNRRMS